MIDNVKNDLVKMISKIGRRKTT